MSKRSQAFIFLKLYLIKPYLLQKRGGNSLGSIGGKAIVLFLGHDGRGGEKNREKGTSKP